MPIKKGPDRIHQVSIHHRNLIDNEVLKMREHVSIRRGGLDVLVLEQFRRKAEERVNGLPACVERREPRRGDHGRSAPQPAQDPAYCRRFSCSCATTQNDDGDTRFAQCEFERFVLWKDLDSGNWIRSASASSGCNSGHPSKRRPRRTSVSERWWRRCTVERAYGCGTDEPSELQQKQFVECQLRPLRLSGAGINHVY